MPRNFLVKLSRRIALCLAAFHTDVARDTSCASMFAQEVLGQPRVQRALNRLGIRGLGDGSFTRDCQALQQLASDLYALVTKAVIGVAEDLLDVFELVTNLDTSTDLYGDKIWPLAGATPWLYDTGVESSVPEYPISLNYHDHRLM